MHFLYLLSVLNYANVSRKIFPISNDLKIKMITIINRSYIRYEKDNYPENYSYINSLFLSHGQS